MIPGHTVADLDNALATLIQRYEGWSPTAYFNHGDVPTIGYGVAFVYKVNDTDYAARPLDTLNDWFAGIYVFTPAEQNVLVQIADSLTEGNEFVAMQLFSSWGPAAALVLTEALGEVVLGRAVPDVTANAIPQSILTGLASTQELSVLYSLAYNSPGLVGQHLESAIINDDRASAWYEIRYQSNKEDPDADVENGIAKRRYAESQQFGLYDDTQNVTETDAREVFRMFTLHEDIIRNYDDKYDEQIGKANSDYDLTGDDAVQTRVEAFGDAKEMLAQLYVEPFGHTAADIDEVYIDIGLNNIDRTPNNKPAGRDLIFGEGGGDEIHAGTMNDIVYGDYGSLALDIAGDAGNDTLYGDAGDDTLIGGAEADELPQGDIDADSLDGGGGSDVLRGGVGADTLAGGSETGEPTYMNFDQLYGGQGKDHFVCWGSEQIWDATSDETFTIGGLTVSGGSWQFVGKEINENEEQGYVDTYGYVGGLGEIYTLSYIEIEGEFVLCLGIQIYDRDGEFTNDWEVLQEVGIVGFENDVGFMGINIEELNSFSAMTLSVGDLLGGNPAGQESAVINQSMANLFSRMELAGNPPPSTVQIPDAALQLCDG